MADMAKDAHRFAQAAMQKASYQISDLLRDWPEELWVFFLASAQSFVSSLTPQLTDLDRELFSHLVEHTTGVVLPESMDPRRHGDGKD